MSDDFRVVVPGSRRRWPCSPALPPGTLGIALSAPARVPLGPGDATDDAFARVIVCGAYRFPSNFLGLREQLAKRLLLVAVDAASHRAYAGRVAPPGEDPGPDPYRGLSDADLEGQLSGGWFNPNLAAILPLPERPAGYWVYAQLGEHVSNVVRIDVEEAR